MPQSKFIFKHNIPLRKVVILNLPQSSKILSVGVQDGEIFIWNEFNDGDDKTTKFIFYPECTGWKFDLSEKSVFLGTVQPQEGLVFHVYYEKV